MPVKFRGRSEYAKNFKWNNSFRSAAFVPKFEQVKRDAGLRSDQIFSLQEPKFATKRHVWHREPQVQSCLMWWPEDNNQASTGTNSEVTNSDVVETRIKSRKQRSPRQPTKQRKNDRIEPKTPPSTPTGKREVALQSNSASPKLRESGLQITESPNKKSPYFQSPYKKNKFTQAPPKLSYKNLSPKKVIDKTPEKITTPRKEKELPVQKTTGNNLQTNMLSKSTTKNIPLKRKAGISVSRTSLARQSEYQRRYSPPRNPVKSAPLISALDIVHQSSSAVAPPLRTKPVYRTTSEYHANFCRNYKSSQSKLNVLQPNQQSPPSPSMRLKVKTLQNPQHILPPHAAKVHRVMSEYNREFSPKKSAEVEERQELAEENKQRHEGTHIDPNHLMQVSCKTNKFWDMSSRGSEAPSRQEKDNSEADDISVESIPDNDSTYKNDLTSDVAPVKTAWSENSDTQDDNESTDIPVSEDAKHNANEKQPTTEGRVTTPRLNELHGALRTHHDLTTPCKGGALLVSLPRKQGSSGSFISNSASNVTSQSYVKTPSKLAGAKTADVIPLVTERKIPLTRRITTAVATNGKENLSKTSPAKYGKPTNYKTTLKSNENIPKSPPKFKMTKPKSDNRALSAPIKGLLNSEEFQHCGPGPKTTPLNFSELSVEDKFDNLSLASSRVSARTQDLLDKVKERKNFWSTK